MAVNSCSKQYKAAVPTDTNYVAVYRKQYKAAMHTGTNYEGYTTYNIKPQQCPQAQLIQQCTKYNIKTAAVPTGANHSGANHLAAHNIQYRTSQIM